MYVTVPGAPANFTTTSLFAHGATLSWKQPMELNGIILGFMITTVTADYKLAQPVEAPSSLGLSISDNNTVALPSSHLSFQLTNLHAYSEYHVKIQAQTSIGLGISSWLLLETPQTSKSHCKLGDGNLHSLCRFFSNICSTLRSRSKSSCND